VKKVQKSLAKLTYFNLFEDREITHELAARTMTLRGTSMRQVIDHGGAKSSIDPESHREKEDDRMRIDGRRDDE
jgi:hypothetical protein